MKCSKCGFENLNSFKFCCQCGAKLEVINKCHNCGTTLPYYVKFCPECGTRVGVEQIDTDDASGIDTCPKELEFLVDSCSFKMIKVDGGTFTMGATAEQGDDAIDDELPVHQVSLSDYYIGQTEVTQSLWKAVMGKNPSFFKGNNLPVENVHWYDCQIFIQKLNSLLSNQLGGMRFALPTEAQWEFAARGGNQSKGYKYAGSNNICKVAWYDDFDFGRSHPVAQKLPNELSLYDMSGNVREWCQDWYTYYSSDAQTNPKGRAYGAHRVTRGGGFHSGASSCRVSNRGGYEPDSRYRDLGLRLCLIVKANSRNCSKCGFDNPDSLKFCGQCGAKLEVINKCHNCGTTLINDAQFCHKCGTRVGVELISKEKASGIDTCPKELEFVVGSCRFKMIKVDGGTFTMGATAEQGDDASDDERPTHKVTLSDYYIGETLVTQALWKAVVNVNPSHQKGDNLPVDNVSWEVSQIFIERLNSIISSHLGGMQFALPTEAQWEFAARGGNKSKGYKYAGSNNIDDVAWYRDNNGDKSVAQKQPNELGLYDMSGNVGEWCQDWYDEGYYRISPENNPQGPAYGAKRVVRSGGRFDFARDCRVSDRGGYEPDSRYSGLGLRLCLLP